MDVQTQTRNSSMLSWISIIIAIIALLFAFAAYSRAGVSDHDDMAVVTDELNDDDELNQLNLQKARLEAATRLTALEARQETAENYEEFEAEVKDIREDLASAYAEAKLESSQEWTELQGELDTLEQNIRDKSANVLDVLRAFTARLSTDVRSDSEDGE